MYVANTTHVCGKRSFCSFVPLYGTNVYFFITKPGPHLIDISTESFDPVNFYLKKRIACYERVLQIRNQKKKMNYSFELYIYRVHMQQPSHDTHM